MNREVASSPQTNLQHVSGHGCLSASAASRDESEEVLSPNNQLRRDSSDLSPLVHWTVFGTPTPVIIASPTVEKIRPNSVSSLAQENHDDQTVIDNRNIVEKGAGSSGSDHGNDSNHSASMLAMVSSTTSDELTPISTDTFTDKIDLRQHALSGSNNAQSLLGQLILLNHPAVPDKSCSGEMEESVWATNKAQNVLLTAFTRKEPPFAAIETSPSAIQEASETRARAKEYDLAVQSRDNNPDTARFQAANTPDNLDNLTRRKVATEEDPGEDLGHISGHDESEGEDPPSPVKRRRLGQDAPAAISTPSTRRCSVRRLRPGRQARHSSLQSRAPSPDELATCAVEPRALPRPKVEERGDVRYEQKEMAATECREFSFQGVMKCIAIGKERKFTLEFSLPGDFGAVNLPGPGQRIGPPKTTFPAPLSTGDKWTPQEDTIVRRMKRDGCSWTEIHSALPHRSKAAIQIRYSTRLKGSLDLE